MKTFFTSLFFLVFLFINAQEPVKRTCGTETPGEAWDKWFNEKVKEFIENNPQAKEQANYTIPVIFHVIYDNQPVGTFPNLTQAQIHSQIPILNNDFAGTGFNVSNFSSTTFNQALIANCNITFCLAKKDPTGATLNEPGIHRVSYSASGWTNPASFTTQASFKNYMDGTIKSNSIWDPSRYLNIWISDVNTTVGLLGYATFPPASGLTGMPAQGTILDDGVWCWSRAIGDVGFLNNAYSKGRTVTHEVGHYLGLRHIWGDSNCGTDYCNDTPTQQAENTTCPTFPHVTCSNGPNGDMFMNFMDYCYDACLYMFTGDQRTRMQTAMANSTLRKNLTASAATLCAGSDACTYTITNFSSTDTLQSYRRSTAASSDAFCLQGPGKAGYIVGSNCYGDKEKAEFYAGSKYASVTGPHVSGVVVLFYQYINTGTDGTGNVGLNLYSGTSANTAPGSLLGSISENLSTIAATTNTNGVNFCGNPNLAFANPIIMPFKFNFTSPVPVPQSGFFASVVLPTSSNDTVAILDKRTGTTNTAWEKWDNNIWHDMKSAWGDVRNFNLAILPVIECGPVGLKNNSILFSGVDLFPNPSNGDFTIVTTLPTVQRLKINVYSMMGQLVYQDVVEQAKQNLIEIKMHDQSPGIYFVQLDNGEEKVVKRMILTR
ncbi:hypothetical protein CNR22_16860 [Sphingobacteriaceae bacterium]|nr:hypothetical protein CNR22_16860 [Sphingobacteriaceae bacterium]